MSRYLFSLPIYCLVCFLAMMVKTSKAQVYGCTDPLATNFNSAANTNDGTCLYASSSISPSASYDLDISILETSGLILWDSHLLTHNDNDDVHLYYLDTLNGHVLSTDSLGMCINKEWEEISQDSNYVYVGDFGNNSSGNRTDLHILRIAKNSLLLDAPLVDTIYFSYADQTDFTAHASNTTDYDCESFIVSKDSIYLFTKQWQSKQTCVYALPKVPGNYSAQPRDTFNVNGLITGATYLEDKQLLVLCGYTNLLQPFSYLCYDFQRHDFFGGNKRRLEIALPFTQMEGVATSNGLKYYMSNESFIQAPLINSPQKLHIFDFSSYLSGYLSPIVNGLTPEDKFSSSNIYPNPVSDFCYVNNLIQSNTNIHYRILDIRGERLFEAYLQNSDDSIDMRKFADAQYIIELLSPINKRFSILKQNK